MSVPVLTYFDSKGLAEAARLIFAESGVKFDDVRIKNADFPAWKKEHEAKLPFGQVPILEIDGVTIAQSQSIYRLLARRYGLYGKTDVEGAHADMVADATKDIGNAVRAFKMPLLDRRSDEDKKNGVPVTLTEEEKEALFKQKEPARTLANLDKLLGSKEYFAGSTFTYVDIVISVQWDLFYSEFSKQLDQFKNLKEHHKRVTERKPHLHPHPHNPVHSPFKSKPVLSYFNGRARAEPARLIFAEAGVAYEDNRISGDDLKKLIEQGRVPFSQVPILEFDGVTIAQSVSIWRFLAIKFGLYGTTDIDGALADMVVDCNTDIGNLVNEIGAAKKEENEEKRKVKVNEAIDKLLSQLHHLENILKKNKVANEDVYFVKGKFTYADIVISNRWYSLSTDYADRLTAFENLKKHFDLISNRPGIKKWMEERPKTSF